MRLYNLKKTVNNKEIRVSISIDSKKLGKKELWFSTELKYKDSICENQFDAFLVGLLYPAMVYGEDIIIEGKTSKKLLFNINHYVIPLIMSFSQSCKKIRVTSLETTSEEFKGKGVGTGFSGGIDSFCTIYDQYELQKDPEYRINSFLFLNVGAHGSDIKSSHDKFITRYKYLKSFPEEIGLDFIPVDSNLHSFHPWGHQLTCSLTLASGVLFMQKSFDKYYCASLGWTYIEILQNYKTDLDKDIAMFDPILLPLLSTESTQFIADGSQYTRTQKTLRIIDYEPVQRYLNVCVSGDATHENCSVCSKCCRTLMTLDSANELDKFERLFDVKKYKNIAKKQYVYEQVIFQDSDPFAKGNVELARNNKVKLPNKVASLTFLMPKLIRTRTIKALRNNLSEETINKIKTVIKK